MEDFYAQLDEEEDASEATDTEEVEDTVLEDNNEAFDEEHVSNVSDESEPES